VSIVVVQDANVFIDLQTARVLDVLFRMDWEFHTTDAVLDEVEESLDEHIRTGLLQVRRMSGGELAAIVILRGQQPRRISIEDCTLLDLAARLRAVLLTGDANLRFCAERSNIQVRGTLWVLDMLTEAGRLTPRQAGAALQRLMKAGRRLPADECQARIQRWAGAEGSACKL